MPLASSADAARVVSGLATISTTFNVRNVSKGTAMVGNSRECLGHDLPLP